MKLNCSQLLYTNFYILTFVILSLLNLNAVQPLSKIKADSYKLSANSTMLVKHNKLNKTFYLYDLSEYNYQKKYKFTYKKLSIPHTAAIYSFDFSQDSSCLVILAKLDKFGILARVQIDQITKQTKSPENFVGLWYST